MEKIAGEMTVVDYNDPLYGIDISDYQGARINFPLIKEEGYDFVFVKASEGWGPEGHQKHYRGNAAEATQAGHIVGAYHFLWGNSVSKQIDSYLRVTDGNLENKMITLDVETYPGQARPHIGHVKGWIEGMHKRFPNKRIIVYSAPWYWNDFLGNPSLDEYKFVTLWDAHYVLAAGYGGFQYRQVPLSWWKPRWGGGKPHRFLQISDKGIAGNLNPVDMNVYSGDMNSLRRMAGLPEKPDTERERQRTHFNPPYKAPFPPYGGASRNWSPRARRLVQAVEKKWGLTCATYANHGRTGTPYGIDIMIAPFMQRANKAQEAYGDRVQKWLEANWHYFGLDYIIYWNWMKDGADTAWFDYSPWSKPASQGGWPYGNPDMDTRRHLDHIHVQVRR